MVFNFMTGETAMTASERARHIFNMTEKPTRAKTIKALQYYYENPTLSEELWQKIFPGAAPAITIPHYLHYREGWTHEDFKMEFGISRPTFYSWMTTIVYRPALREEFMDAMDWSHEPVDEEQYEEALNNENQFKPQGKSREYVPSKHLRMKLDKEMNKKGRVNAEDFATTNKWRTLQQIKNHALTKGWREILPGIYKKGKPKFKLKTMDQIIGD